MSDRLVDELSGGERQRAFLALALENGCQIKDGEDMLLFQGVLAFEYFTNTKADENLVEAMRKGLKENS